MQYYENLKDEIEKKLESIKAKIDKALSTYQKLELSQGEDLMITDFSGEKPEITLIEKFSIENAWWSADGFFLNIEFKDGATAQEHTMAITHVLEFRTITITSIL